MPTKTIIHCPICDGRLQISKQKFMICYDGNTVFVCDADPKHRFWNNEMEQNNILHYHPDASVDTFKSIDTYTFTQEDIIRNYTKINE